MDFRYNHFSNDKSHLAIFTICLLKINLHNI
nr:MAG TPA: hypothetical protein [Caudoviricetes sp.]